MSILPAEVKQGVYNSAALDRDGWNGKFFPYDDELSSIHYSSFLLLLHRNKKMIFMYND